MELERSITCRRVTTLNDELHSSLLGRLKEPVGSTRDIYFAVRGHAQSCASAPDGDRWLVDCKMSRPCGNISNKAARPAACEFLLAEIVCGRRRREGRELLYISDLKASAGGPFLKCHRFNYVIPTQNSRNACSISPFYFFFGWKWKIVCILIVVPQIHSLIFFLPFANLNPNK